METGYKVSEVMVRDVFTTSANTNIVECARKMADNKIGCLIVKQGGKIVGIITEQDLARKVLAAAKSYGDTTVKDVMSTLLHTIEPDRDIYDAFTIMGNKQIKHLPVMSGGKLHGIITAKDVLQIQPGLIELLSFNSSTKRKR